MHYIIEKDISRILEEDLPWEKLRDSSVLITGSSGILGSYIVYTLIELNKRLGLNIMINALCRSGEKAKKRFFDYLQEDNFNIFYQDVCDEINDRYKSDIIIHAASPANPRICSMHPYEVIRANVLACNNLIEKCKSWGTKEFCFFSSSAVYGHSSPLEGITEEYRGNIDFTNCKDVYSLAKQMCEMMMISAEKECECTMKAVRPFVVYGPGESYSHKKCLTDFMKNCILNENIIIKSNGEAIRSYIYICDAVRAFFYVLLKGERGAYNIASGSSVYNIKEVADIFSKIRGVKLEYKKDNVTPYLQTSTNVMVGKTEKLNRLGWREEVSFEEGIKRTLKWAEEGEFLNT